MSEPLTAVSLFAGIGGIDLAFRPAGIRTVAAVEIDPACRGVLADRFPGVTLLTDVREVTGDQLRASGFVPERGVVTAGWPCQDNSVAGRRAGMGGARSGLWVHVARLLAELRPAWFIGENVPGLLSVNGGRDFASVIGDVAECGMGVAWRTLDAQYFGVPQRRRRVIIVGRSGDRAAPVQVLFEPEGMRGDTAPGASSGPDVAGTLGSRAGGGRGTGLDGCGDHTPVASSLEASTGGADDNDARGGHLVVTALTTRSGATYDDQQIGQLVPVVYQCHGGNVGPAGTVKGDGSVSGGVPFMLDQVGVRRLTPTECERVMGLPDGWTATSNYRPQSDNARYRQVGNSVAVPVLEWVARRVVAHDEAKGTARMAGP